MRFLNKRTEIARAINLDKDLVVLEIDVANEIILGRDMVCGYKGCKVEKLDMRANRSRGEIKYFKDDKKVVFSENCICISNNFGCNDVIEMLEFRKAPVLVKGCRCLLVAYNSKTGKVLSPAEFIYNGGTVICDGSWIEALEE